MRMCNVSRGRVLQLTAMAYIRRIYTALYCAGRAEKMRDFEMLLRDSRMSGVFAGYSSKNREVGNKKGTIINSSSTELIALWRGNAIQWLHGQPTLPPSTDGFV